MKEQVIREPFKFTTLLINQIRENISEYKV